MFKIQKRLTMIMKILLILSYIKKNKIGLCEYYVELMSKEEGKENDKGTEI